MHLVARFPPGTAALAGSTFRVRISDISAADRQDQPLVRVAFRLMGGEREVDMTLEIPKAIFDERASHNVFVHVDNSGSDEVDLDDYISTATHPVITHSAGHEANVQLVAVR